MAARQRRGISAIDLDRWADRLEAQAELPVLARRLVHASLDAPSRVDFAAHEGILVGGWDGIVETAEGNAYVPPGRSLWELSVRKDVKKKADGDYQKRLENPGGYSRKESTFIFLTLRKWAGKRSWADTRRAENVWGDVRAYDASDLEQWLETAPSVEPWIGSTIGRVREDLRDLEEFWARWSAATTPPLSPEVVLCGRQTVAERIRTWLEAAPSLLYLQGDSSEEATAALTAVLLSLPDDRKAAALARSVVALSSAGVRHVATARQSLVICAEPAAIREATAVATTHHVVIPLAQSAPTAPECVRLPKLDVSELPQRLKAIGLSEERASAVARDCGGYMGPLRRAIAAGPSERMTAWSTPAEAHGLIPVLLAGSWDESRKDDVAAVERMARRQYAEVAAILARWLNEADPPLRRSGNIWQWVSRTEGWQLLARYVTSADVDAFQGVCQDILQAIDPRFELPSEERWLANVQGKVLGHSHHLRQGLAESIALLGSLPESAEIRDARGATARASSQVFGLLREPPPHRWASLSDLLPTLAEGAPEAFIDCVDRLVGGQPPRAAELFAEEKGGLSPHSYHTGLLWALEGLAWSAELLPQVAVLLARLAAIDPGGNLANRPASSLRQIFLGWYPQTGASLDQRLVALDAALRASPEVGWRLLLDLLPRYGGDSSWPLHKPRWRPWAAKWKEGSSRSDYARCVEGISQRLTDRVGCDPGRWSKLIDGLGMISAPHRGAALDRLEACVRAGMPEPGRSQLWGSLRGLLHRHRSHLGAGWALPEAILDRLNAVYLELAPEDLSRRHQWLFSWSVQLPDPPRADDWQAEEVAAERMRREAIELLVEAGVETVLATARDVTEPYMYARYLGEYAMPAETEAQLVRTFLAQEGMERLLAGFVAGCFERGGWTWVERVLVGQGVDSAAKILAAIPFEARTWDMARTHGVEVEARYWQLVPARGLRERADTNAAVTQLLAARRPWTAVLLVEHQVDRRTKQLPVDDRLIADALERAAAQDPIEELGRRPENVGYSVGELLDILTANARLDRPTLARLEWLYLPVVSRWEREPRTLHGELAANPTFFAEVVSWVFRPEDEGDDAAAPEPAPASEQERNRARVAYDLLSGWTGVPGMEPGGAFDPAVFRDWVLRARRECANRRRAGIGDDRVGEVISHTPSGPDGVWPVEGVRDVIEELASTTIEEAIEVGLLNQRGVITRSPTGGGTLERDLARQYRDNATAVAGWPRTASLLRRIADNYEFEARRWDLDSELRE